MLAAGAGNPLRSSAGGVKPPPKVIVKFRFASSRALTSPVPGAHRLPVCSSRKETAML